MKGALAIIFFLLIVSTVYFVLHYYVYHRISRGLELNQKWRKAIALFFLLGGLLFILSQVSSRFYSVWIVSYIGSVWLGVIAIAFSVFIIRDIFLLIFPQIKWISTIIALAIIIIISSYSLINVLCGVRVRRLEIWLKSLPAELDGYSIVQLSDLHLGTINDTDWLESVVDRTNRLYPDLILITGDLVDEEAHRIDRFRELFKNLNANDGVFAVTGNHEYFPGVEKFFQLAEQSGITVLSNSCTTLANGIVLVGLNDDVASRFDMEGPNLHKALAGCDTANPVILLYHRPTHFKDAVSSGVDIQLSGHTHLGQLPPMDLIVLLVFGRYAYGLRTLGDSYIYTTSGTGTWGPPMRFLSHSEIVNIILHPK